jgi:hypothetical protein
MYKTKIDKSKIYNIQLFKITNEIGIYYCDIILCIAFDAAIRLGLLLELTSGTFAIVCFWIWVHFLKQYHNKDQYLYYQFLY